jgi:GNAT superfamily N-acetyltransferase
LIGLNIRPARPEDRDAWLAVWDEAAAAAFLPLLPTGGELPPVIPDLWDELVAMPDLALLMAEADGRVLGYTGCGSSRDEDVDDHVGEVRSLFVTPSSWRRGVGRALMNAALEELRNRGYANAIVWSFEANDRANRFYERFGFEADRAERIEERFAGMTSIRYRRSL